VAPESEDGAILRITSRLEAKMANMPFKVQGSIEQAMELNAHMTG